MKHFKPSRGSWRTGPVVSAIAASGVIAFVPASEASISFFALEDPGQLAAWDLAVSGLRVETVQDFSAANLPAGFANIDDTFPIDENTDNGVFSPGDIHPSLAFQGNTGTPGLTPNNPVGFDNFGAITTGLLDNPQNALYGGPSIDVLSQSSDHVAMEIFIFDAFYSGDGFEVLAFDANEALLGSAPVPLTLIANTNYAGRVGVLVDGGDSLGRINLWTGLTGGPGVMEVTTYVVPGAPSAALFGSLFLWGRRRRRSHGSLR